MKKSKLKAAICGIVCGLTAIAMPFSAASEVQTDSTNNTIKIMSIGDSITDGYGTEGSYRKFLYKNLTDKGLSIDMVGPNAFWGDGQYTDTDTGESFSYDAAHCGYSGYSIKDYPGRNGILETIKSGDYLSMYTPDIVILQIGTNDVIDNHEIDSAGERLDILVSYILDNISQDSRLFVTTIPDLEPNRQDVYAWFSNYRHSADWQTQYSDTEAEAAVADSVKKYNSQVKELVLSKQAAGVKNIFMGDINSVVTDVKTQLKDGVHPNDIGYKLMGNYWTDVVYANLTGNAQEPSTEPVTQEPSTEPVTQEPSTEPVTQEPSTEPVTQEPSTEPVTQEPSTEPVTQEPSTEPDTQEPTPQPITEQPPLEPVKRGDVNEDCFINTADITLLTKELLGLEPLTWYADVNRDGLFNITDLILLKRMVLTGDIYLAG